MGERKGDAPALAAALKAVAPGTDLMVATYDTVHNYSPEEFEREKYASKTEWFLAIPGKKKMQKLKKVDPKLKAVVKFLGAHVPGLDTDAVLAEVARVQAEAKAKASEAQAELDDPDDSEDEPAEEESADL